MSDMEGINRQDLLLALADNLQDTMQQFTSIMGLISDNSLRIKGIEEKINNLANEFLDISNNQSEINDYISILIIDINDRVEKLTKNIRLLGKEG